MSRLNLLCVPFVALAVLPVNAAEPLTATTPLETLRVALKVPVFDQEDEEELKFRRDNLSKHVAALRPAELGAALRLDEWRHRFVKDPLIAVDKAARAQVGKRWATFLRGALKSADAGERRAALIEIAESPLFVRETEEREFPDIDFTAELLLALKDKDEAVCRTAAVAVGRTFPRPKETAAALLDLLTGDAAPRRRAAATALATWMTTARTAAQTPTYQDVPIPAPSLFQAATAAVEVAARGAADADPLISRPCLEALGHAVTVLNGLTISLDEWQRRGERGTRHEPEFLLLPGRTPTARERLEIDAAIQAAAQERKLTLPLERALAAALPALARAVGSKDRVVCQAACTALEPLPMARRKLMEKATALAPFAKENAGKPADPLGPALAQAVTALAELTAHADVELRLAALYTLEEFTTDAAPAVAAVVKALQDRDPFVRWAAVRVLGKMAPREAQQAVPGLARAVADENGDVRATAMVALERYGPAAAAAGPELAKAVSGSEPATRLLAIRTLVAIGPGAKPAVPALGQALAAKEVEVRIAAADALARLGPAARAAAEPLRNALDDPNADVRRRAAEALLGLKE